MELDNTYLKPEQIRSSRRVCPFDQQDSVGLRIDQAALAWLTMQSQQGQLGAYPNVHPVAFIKVLCEQVNERRPAKQKRLLKESYKHRNIPSQHLNDHHFTRSLKYLSNLEMNLFLCDRQQAKAGDIVVFTEQGAFTKVHWALCGSGGRLYHVNSDGDRVVCSNVQHQNHLFYIIEVDFHDSQH